jgi:AcrR family transcriptional regulator
MNIHSYVSKIKMLDRETRKKQITTRRREQILKAAMEVFSRKGYAAATIPEIAKLAGVAAGTIYLYYPSKRELFIAVIQNFIITVPLLNIIENMPKSDFPAILKRIMQNRLNFTEGDNMSYITSLMGEIQRDPELKALFSENLIQPFLSRMESYYRSLMTTGEIRKVKPAIVVRAIGGMILGFIMLKSMEGDASPLRKLSQDKVTDELVNVVLHGLLNTKETDND